MKNETGNHLVRPIQSIRYVASNDLAKIVTLTLCTIKVAHLHPLQVFAIGDVNEDGKTIVSMTIVFHDPMKVAKKLAELVRIILVQASENGNFKGNYTFEVSAQARGPVRDPMGVGPMGFADRIWDRYCQLAA